MRLYEENKCSHNTCLAVLAIVPRYTPTAVTPKCIHTRGPVLTGFSFAFIYIYDGKNKVILSMKHLVCLITFWISIFTTSSTKKKLVNPPIEQNLNFLSTPRWRPFWMLLDPGSALSHNNHITLLDKLHKRLQWRRSGGSRRVNAQRETSNSVLRSCAQVELDQYTRAVPSARSLYVILYLWELEAGIFEVFLNSVHTSKWPCREFFGKISRGQPVTSPLFVYKVKKQLPVWQFLLLNPGLHLQR